MNRFHCLVAALGACLLFSAAGCSQTDLDAAIQRVRAREAVARTRITQFEADLAKAQSILARARQLQSPEARQAEQYTRVADVQSRAEKLNQIMEGINAPKQISIK